MENEKNKKVDKRELEKQILKDDVEDEVMEEKKENKDVSSEESIIEEKVGKATFQETSNSKLPFIAIIVAILFVVAALFFRWFDTNSTFDYVKYTNHVHGYSYMYPEEMQLVDASNNLAELERLRLMDSDSRLLYVSEVSGDQTVYTILELSYRPSYGDFDSYSTALFDSLAEYKKVTGSDYVITDSEVGDKIASTEYSFEMEVPIDDAGNTRTGVFYDNIFKVDDGRSYSISFGYPKNTEDPQKYVSVYRNILKSFRVIELTSKDEDVLDNVKIEIEEVEQEVVE